jgi:Velvet factor
MSECECQPPAGDHVTNSLPVTSSDTGPPRTHTDVSPVLAQAFTDPFMVYSAKRFPGVPGEYLYIFSFPAQLRIMTMLT